MRYLFIFLSIFLFMSLGNSQDMNIIWDREFKGSQKSILGKDIALANNIIYFAAQDYNSKTGSDFFTVAMDISDGLEIWSGTYSSGQGQTSDYPEEILIKNDVPYIYGSSAKYEAGLYLGQDFKLISYDGSGRLSFNQQYDWGFNDMPNAGIVVNDNIVLAGYSDLGHFAQPRAKTISVNDNATKPGWDYIDDGDFFTRSEIIAVATEGKFLYQTGVRYQGGTYTDTLSRQKSETVKLDLNGNVIWSQSFGLNSKDVRPVDINLLSNGDPVITHNTTSGDVVVARLNASNGEEIWTQFLSDQGVAVQSLISGREIFVLIGNKKDIVVVKLDARNGRSLWRQPFIFDSGLDDYGVKLMMHNGKLYILSTINNQVGVLSVSHNGKLAEQYFYGSENGAKDEAVDLILADNMGYLLFNRFYNSGFKAVVSKVDFQGAMIFAPSDIGKGAGNPVKFQLRQNYPNPFNPVTTIGFMIPEPSEVHLAIYNSLGQEVTVLINDRRPAGEYRVDFNATNLPSGAYFCHLTAGGHVTTQKMLLLK